MASIRNKQIDLLVAYNRSDEPSPLLKTFKIIAVPAILIVVFVSIFIVFTVMKMDKTNKINDAKAENEIIQLKIDATDKKPYEELQSLQTTFAALEELDKSLSTLPELTKQKILYIQKDLIAGISLSSLSFDQKSNLLTVSLASSNVQNIEKYVTKLKKHVEYSSVEYTGYQESVSSSTNTGSGLLDGLLGNITEETVSSYGFQVKITLDGKAGE
ncbi:MAG: hypothetical protein RR512_04935 [Coprobacillus sp.]